MASVDSTKVYETVTIDPNFSLPPGVIDVGYKNIDEAGDSPTDRSTDTGEVINVDYDEVTYGEDGGEGAEDDSPAAGDTLFAPDSVTLLSQQTRITTDGRVVVDVILEVPDTAPGITYDVRLTKP